jgi:hypothetical protein
MTLKRPPNCFDVEVEMDGKQSGFYTVDSGVVSVSYVGVRRTATRPIGHASPETIARMLLKDLVVEARRR